MTTVTASEVTKEVIQSTFLEQLQLQHVLSDFRYVSCTDIFWNMARTDSFEDDFEKTAGIP